MAFVVALLRHLKLVSRLLTDSVLRILVSGFSLTLSYSNHKDYDLLIQNLIDQSISGAAQFEFVAVGELAKPIGFNARILEYFSKFLLELLAQGVPSLFHSFNARRSNSRL